MDPIAKFDNKVIVAEIVEGMLPEHDPNNTLIAEHLIMAVDYYNEQDPVNMMYHLGQAIAMAADVLDHESVSLTKSFQ